MVSELFPLSLTRAVVRRKGKTLLGPLDLSLSGDGLTVIIGPNGAGKTTLLRVMHGVERLSGGALEWAIPDTQARARQAYVFQAPIMLRRSVFENLIYPLKLLKTPKTDRDIAARQWAARIGLQDAHDTRATRLSGGERQKLALARALIRKPDVLFLDEPCANLDGRSTREIEEILHEAQAAGTRIILVTHDIGQARRLGSEVIFMLRGLVHERGPATDLLSAPKTPELKAFLKGDIIE